MATANPPLTLAELSLIQSRIESRTESKEDYEKLDYFLSSVGIRLNLLQRFRENGIDSYEQYVVERKKTFETRKMVVDGTLYGVVSGAINFLKNILANKI